MSDGCGNTGSFVRTWKATDECGNESTSQQTITIVDTTAPVLSAAPGNTTVECDSVPAPATLTAADTCDPSVPVTYTQTRTDGNCANNYTLTRTWTATDDCGNSSSKTQVITVQDTTAPIITSVTGPTGPIALGNSASVTVNFVENCSATSTATFNWDDGSQSTASGAASATGSHIYANPGVYTITVTVADACGNISLTAVYEFIVIYDPSTGFVTGGGWIMTAAGSYPANPLLYGRANFGFVSKYKKGQSIPTGETEFQFQAAGFNFHSTSYYWLVVSGYKAQYKGTGTVNGVPGYEFLLTAYDGNLNGGGGADKFRIKIWNSGGVVYDNKISKPDDIDTADPQIISGGSIVIHK